MRTNKKRVGQTETGKRITAGVKPNAKQSKKPGTVERGRPTVERKRKGEKS